MFANMSRPLLPDQAQLLPAAPPLWWNLPIGSLALLQLLYTQWAQGFQTLKAHSPWDQHGSWTAYAAKALPAQVAGIRGLRLVTWVGQMWDPFLPHILPPKSLSTSSILHLLKSLYLHLCFIPIKSSWLGCSSSRHRTHLEAPPWLSNRRPAWHLDKEVLNFVEGTSANASISCFPLHQPTAVFVPPLRLAKLLAHFVEMSRLNRRCPVRVFLSKNSVWSVK